MDHTTVSAQPEEMCGGILQGNRTSSGGNYNSRSETRIALMLYANCTIAELGI